MDAFILPDAGYGVMKGFKHCWSSCLADLSWDPIFSLNLSSTHPIQENGSLHLSQRGRTIKSFFDWLLGDGVEGCVAHSGESAEEAADMFSPPLVDTLPVLD